MTARFEVGDRLQKTGTELIEVAFEVLATDGDFGDVWYELAPVTPGGDKLYNEETWGWPSRFPEDGLEEYEKI